MTRTLQGSWHNGTYMDRNNESRAVWHTPSILVECVERLVAGAGLSVLWAEFDGRITYRTLLRWRAQGLKMRRYRISKWWLENRERIEKLERRGLSLREIFQKTGLPPCYKKVSGARNELTQFWNIWRTFQTLEMAENERWMGRAA